MTIGRILYDNRYRTPAGGTFTYSGTETAGFEKENAIDWRDFSLFKPQTGLGTFFEITHATPEDIDTFCWYVKEPTSTFTMTLQYESAPAAFTTLATYNSANDPVIGMKTFNKVTVLAGRKIRIGISPLADSYIRQVATGLRLDFPIGQHQGIAPPNLRGSFVQSNVIGVNGSFIGRDKVRADIQGSIELEYLEPQTFVRDEWLAVMEHAERYPFWYAWNLDDYPDEVVWAAARETPRPTNTGPADKMRVTLPWAALAE